MILSIFDNYIYLQLNPSVLILFISNVIAVSDSDLIRCCMILYFTSILQWHIQDQFDCLMTLGNTLVILEAVVFVMYVVSGYFIWFIFIHYLSRMMIFNLFICWQKPNSGNRLCFVAFNHPRHGLVCLWALKFHISCAVIVLDSSFMCFFLIYFWIFYGEISLWIDRIWILQHSCFQDYMSNISLYLLDVMFCCVGLPWYRLERVRLRCWKWLLFRCQGLSIYLLS